jgi:hypothetical protein
MHHPKAAQIAPRSFHFSIRLYSTVLAVIQDLSLRGLGWILRNLRLLCCVWAVCSYVLWTLLKEFGGAILGAFLISLSRRGL